MIKTGPRRDLHAHTLCERILAEVRTPWPAGDCNIHNTWQWVEAHFAVSVIGNRTHVATWQSGGTHCFTRGLNKLIDGVWNFHAKNFCALEKTLDVFGEAEHCRTFGGFICANAFEDTGAVMQGVGENVNLGFVPIDEFAIHPDFRCWYESRH